MQELEKILEEIDAHAIEFEIFGTSDDYINIGWVKDIIRKHVNDGWISVEDRLPEVDEDTEETIEDDYCPEYIVTIRGASESTVLKYSPNGTWFDDNGNAYDVIAWRPLPEPYKSKRSEE